MTVPREFIELADFNADIAVLLINLARGWGSQP